MFSEASVCPRGGSTGGASRGSLPPDPPNYLKMNKIGPRHETVFCLTTNGTSCQNPGSTHEIHDKGLRGSVIQKIAAGGPR